MKIAIASGKGCAGKTIVTASLVRVWCAPLVAVEPDADAPNLHLFLHPNMVESRIGTLAVLQMKSKKCMHCEKCRNICTYKRPLLRLLGG